jgi:excisionase family DNA binding protein
MSIAFLLTTLVVVATPGTGAVYSIAAGLSRGSRAGIVAVFGLHPRRPPAHGGGDHRARRDPARLGDRVPGDQVARGRYHKDLLRCARYRERMIMTLKAGERLMSPTDVSEMLGIPVHTLYRWRYKGDAPVGYRVGRHERYRRETVETWLEQQVDKR